MAVGTLIALGGNLENPRDSKPSDYSAVGPSGAAGTSSGAGQLVKQTFNQEGPRHSSDGGENTPSNWGEAGKEYSVGRASEGSTSISIPESVNLITGHVEPNVLTSKK
jgi:hypothetical protein